MKQVASADIDGYLAIVSCLASGLFCIQIFEPGGQVHKFTYRYLTIGSALHAAAEAIARLANEAPAAPALTISDLAGGSR